MSRITRTTSPSNATITSPASATMTITATPTLDNEGANETPKVVTLKLKSKKERQSRHITWSQDTIDNENMNKKKSNLCCIFHPNEDEDHQCDHGKGEEEEIPAGKNVYEFQPKYNCNKK